ncbi:MAG: bifunctional UDP-N-acetylglucosamine diphosphorylase/glucosamine-1-phosphate N-acetyltransferase GlmU [Rhodobacteraceae bacterium]|nr:bifunctional UDP-N-acetylglucosamine diphosphorylase/glucosamine-1-phosphate N-acetyltransferase GlmU [Paracoccaceae bacterium]
MGIALILLAAGQGTRMNSDLPKVLHRVAGAPLIVHALAAGASLAPERRIVVAGTGAAEVAAAARAFDEGVEVVIQDRQLGTGHAVAQALPALAGFRGRVVVLYGDTPFIRPETLAALVAHKADVTVLGFRPRDPGRYGRLVTRGAALERIVEWKDATEEERAIDLCNSGVLACDADLLADLVSGLTNDNAALEYYLTDIVAAARARGLAAGVVTCPEDETLGVNSRAELARAEAAFQARARAALLDDGVTLVAPETVFLAFDTVIGRDSTIGPHVVFGPGVTVESGAEILAFSHLEGCHVGAGARVGPFARLRPGTELGEGAHVGNFVEVKNAVLGDGVKANHLTYLGDAEVGAGTNIGAGTITCNYDGVMKHRTVIGRAAFIGSDTMLVAPVRIGDRAMTASGAVITGDVPDGALAIARAAQVNRPGLAVRLMDRLREQKARRVKDAAGQDTAGQVGLRKDEA